MSPAEPSKGAGHDGPDLERREPEPQQVSCQQDAHQTIHEPSERPNEEDAARVAGCPRLQKAQRPPVGWAARQRGAVERSGPTLTTATPRSDL